MERNELIARIGEWMLGISDERESDIMADVFEANLDWNELWNEAEKRANEAEKHGSMMRKILRGEKISENKKTLILTVEL